MKPVRVRSRAARSCLGEGALAHRDALRHGQSGVKPLDPSRELGTAVAGAMNDGLDARDRRPFALAEATVKSLGLSPDELKESALFVGTTTGVAASEEIAYLNDKTFTTWRAQFLCGGPGRLAAFCTETLGIAGPCFTNTTACTSTGVGLVMAARMLRQGRIKRAVVLGVDLLMKLSLQGFKLLQLASENGCRPFDARRDGLYLGEASAAVVLELGEGPLQFLDGAICHDPGHIAAGSTDGATAADVMTKALQRSQRTAADVTAIKAHGTGTPANDLTELRAMERVFGRTPPPFSSLKSAFGHTLGASAALELAAWTWCVDDGFMPGTIGFEQREPESALAPQLEPRALPPGRSTHLFNAFGFGGTSVSFVVESQR